MAATKFGTTLSDLARTSCTATTSNRRTTRVSTSTTCGLASFASPNTWMLKLAIKTASVGLPDGGGAGAAGIGGGAAGTGDGGTVGAAAATAAGGITGGGSSRSPLTP